MEDFEKAFAKWLGLNSKLFTESNDYIKKVLLEQPNNEVVIDIDRVPCVTYDGGNHPEYAANPYSCVGRVYLKDGNVMLDIEECDEYEINNINAEEAYYVACAVKDTLGMLKETA